MKLSPFVILACLMATPAAAQRGGAAFAARLPAARKARPPEPRADPRTHRPRQGLGGARHIPVTHDITKYTKAAIFSQIGKKPR